MDSYGGDPYGGMGDMDPYGGMGGMDPYGGMGSYGDPYGGMGGYGGDPYGGEPPIPVEEIESMDDLNEFLGETELEPAVIGYFNLETNSADKEIFDEVKYIML